MNSDNAISSCHLPEWVEMGKLGRRYGSGYGMQVGRRRVRV
jgi:hypothetical protein